jgi:hypothetical protein
MTFLDTLEGIDVTKAVTVKDKLIADIELQKQAALAKIRNEPFKEGERFHTWFFEMTDGYYSFLKSGHTAIRIKGRNGFKAGPDLHAVIAFYDEAIETIRTGALDENIEEAVKRRKDTLKKGKEAGKGRKRKLEVAA